MIRHAVVFVAILHATTFTLVDSAKQQVMLSDSYLPVAMQIIAHLTDQMSYESKDDPPKTTSRPVKPLYDVNKPTSKPTSPNRPASSVTPNKPGSGLNRPSSGSGLNKPTTSRPVYVSNSPYVGSFQQLSNGWRFSYYLERFDQTTPHHAPGLYAPYAPPKASERVIVKENGFLLPIDHNSQYTVIEPLENKTEEPLLSIEHTEIKPLMEPKPEQEPLLPHFIPDDGKIASRTSEDSFLIDDEELSDENLQYLAPNVRDMIKLAYNPDDERLIDLDDIRAGGERPGAKGKLSATNLRLQLLYDLLSRDAKKKRLSDYSGFSDVVMRELIDSSSGGARAQLSFALSKMLDRRDCDHEYANNRAREMVAELAKDESGMSAEIRYLQPLVYRL